MKALSQTLIGLVTTTWLSTAIPIAASSSVSFYYDMVIASVGQLPIGHKSRSSPQCRIL
ncbi:MAG: hypothetical protein ACJASL_003168 [Paraglaciecola sp.]|jgi:hypothetical protein